MVDRVYFPQPILPVDRPSQAGGGGKTASTSRSFSEILDQKTLKFSKHAQEMIKQRGIELSTNRINRICEAVDKASAKGSRDSLILVDDLALVVSVKNRTVITAIDGENIKGNIFTNIDSAVIA